MDGIIQKLLDIEEFLSSKAKINFDVRNKNKIAFEKIEKKLNKVQNDFRSDGYKMFKLYSEELIPVGSNTLQWIKDNMTKEELKLCF